MDNSHYIDSIPEAEYEITDSLIAQTPGVQLSGFYSSIVDLISGGNRGQAFTWAINAVDLSTNAAQLQAAYDRNPEAINGYLQNVDLNKLIRMMTAESEQQARFSLPWFRQRVPAFAAGAAIGAAGLAFFNDK